MILGKHWDRMKYRILYIPDSVFLTLKPRTIKRAVAHIHNMCEFYALWMKLRVSFRSIPNCLYGIPFSPNLVLHINMFQVVAIKRDGTITYHSE